MVLVALLAVDATDGASNRGRGRRGHGPSASGSTPPASGAVRALAEDGDGLLWARRPPALGAHRSRRAPAGHPPRTTPERAAGPLRADGAASGRPGAVGAGATPAAARPGAGRARPTSGSAAPDARSLITQRRRQAIVAAGADADADVAARIEAAPRSFVLRVTPGAPGRLRRAGRAAAPGRRRAGRRARRPPRSGPGVTGAGAWSVLVGARDRQGLLAMVSGVLADCGYDVRRAVVGHVARMVPRSRSSRSGDRSCPPPSTSRRRSPPPFGEPLRVRRPARRPRPLRRLELTLAHDLRGRGAGPSPGCSTSWPRPSPAAGVDGGRGVDRRAGRRMPWTPSSW